MRLLTFSKCTLEKDGQAWVRLGLDGPGVRIFDRTRVGLLFARYGKRELRLGRYGFCWLPRFTHRGS